MKKSVSLGIILITVLLTFGALAIKGAGASTGVDNQNLNVAFRDGFYLGNLAAERGESSHIPWGRWARTSDRNSFVTGYKQAYGRGQAERSQQMMKPARAALRDATNAAFRDGLYLGKLDAAEDRPMHISVGRWSRLEDRASFNTGYSQAYDATSLAREEESHGNKLEGLLR